MRGNDATCKLMGRDNGLPSRILSVELLAQWLTHTHTYTHTHTPNRQEQNRNGRIPTEFLDEFRFIVHLSGVTRCT
jgi:hypothetical protein